MKGKARAVWYVYILECKNDRLYTGMTNNMERRFKEHQRKSTHFTSYNPPLRIAHTEECLTRSKALKREAQIKRWPRAKKLALIDASSAIMPK